jgi:hypothetical protein
MSGPPCEIFSIVQVTNVRSAFDRIRVLACSATYHASRANW